MSEQNLNGLFADLGKSPATYTQYARWMAQSQGWQVDSIDTKLTNCRRRRKAAIMKVARMMREE